nr:hypothetical protein [Salinisphaera sp. LB1]
MDRQARKSAYLADETQLKLPVRLELAAQRRPDSAGILQRPVTMLKDSTDPQVSTMNGQTRILVGVHPGHS